ELGRAVLDEHVEFLERALVEQKLDALARGQLAAGVLRLDALFAAAKPGTGAPLLKGVQDVLHLFPPRFSGWISGGSSMPVSAAERLQSGSKTRGAKAKRNGENNERAHRAHRAHRRRDRRAQNPAAARRAGAVCGHGGAVRALGQGRPVVAY